MTNILLKLTFAFSTLLHASSGNFTDKQQYREHKIHNIVLYPDKHSWCKTTAIVQVVGHPGCNSVKMDNNVCVGACFSYIVPRTVPETPGDVSPYCDSCQPGHVSWRKVSLECVEGQFKNQTMTKYVEFIHDCNCGTCKDVKDLKVPTEDDIEVGDNMGDSLIDDYSLNSTMDTNHALLNSSHSEFKRMISGLLGTLTTEEESIMENGEEKNKGLHRNIWKNLLEKVETSNSSIDSNVFNQLVQKVEEEMKVKFNYKRLKQALLKLKKYENITKLNTKATNRSTLTASQNTPLDGLKENSQNATNSFGSDLYSKIYLKSPALEMEPETASPILDVAPHHLKLATSGSEISYHDNVEAIYYNFSSNSTATMIKVENQTIIQSP